MMKEHYLKMRVYAEDLDSFGIVHHSNFLKFMERGRTEWLFDYGFALDQLNQDGIIFPVRSVQLEYLKPARFNDQLHLVTEVKKLGRASITFQQHIYCIEPLSPPLLYSQQLNFRQGAVSANNRNVLVVHEDCEPSSNAAESLSAKSICYAEIKVACVNQNLRPCPLPKPLTEAICGHY